MASAYQLHVRRWAKGCGADICTRASRMVFARGSLPCDILFIGEAPGPSENILGVPFVGPAGHLLDQIINASIGAENRRRQREATGPGPYKGTITYALTNLVACIPLDDGGDKWAEPDEDSVVCCGDRLRELVGIAKPRLIVTVGRLAGDYLSKGYKHSLQLGWDCASAHIVHPASILRANIAQRGLEIQRCVVTLSNAVEDL